MPLDPHVVYNTLLANPSGTLRNYLFRIFGSPDPSGVSAYRLMNRGPSQRPSSSVGNLKMHDTESFDIRSQNSIVGVAPANSFFFNAHSIHMDAGALEMDFYALGGAGPNIVVTGQLSGCSFIMRPGAAGAVDVAHVRAVDGLAPATLATALAHMPNAQVYGGIDTTGNYDFHDREASIIGVRTAGQWAIYAQKQQPDVTGVHRIKSVYQIWPARVKQG